MLEMLHNSYNMGICSSPKMYACSPRTGPLGAYPQTPLETEVVYFPPSLPPSPSLMFWIKLCKCLAQLQSCAVLDLVFILLVWLHEFHVFTLIRD